MKSAMASAAAAAIVLASRAALACPACAGREGHASARWLLLGAMIAVPFLVAGIVVGIVRRAESASRQQS